MRRMFRVLIGILSDSHGKRLLVRKACELFDSLDVEYIIHCGDLDDSVNESILDEFVDRRATFVWGNVDQPDGRLLAYLESVGISPPTGIPTLVELGGKRLAVFHGHEAGFRDAPYTLDVDVILHGHSHACCDESLNGVRIINPGALHRARRKTVAVFDTQTDELTFHEISTR